MNLLAAQPYASNYAGVILKRSFLVFVVVLFFCDIAIYLSLAVSPRLQPQYWIALLAVLGGVLALFSPRTRWQVFQTPVFLWCVLFLVLTLAFYFSIPASHIEQLKERIRDVVLLTAFLAIFLMLPDQMNFLRKLVLIAVVLGVVINFISLMHANFLRPPGVTWAYRPAGFYINPNESGIALVLGMLVSIGILPQRWRTPLATLTLAGIAVTFSREAVLGWVLVVVCCCLFGILNWRSVLLYLAALCVCFCLAIGAMLVSHKFGTSTLHFYGQQMTRFVLHPGDLKLDNGDAIRLAVMRAGWIAFLAHPLIGNGIGYTYHWTLPVSTHNMYLLYMDDYGVIGFFLYPLLIGCMIRGAVGETRKLAWTMAIFLLFWGLFDHNIVQNYYSLFAISLTAAMVWLSRKEPVLKPELAPARAGSG